MRNILMAEFKYNWYYLVILSFLFSAYTLLNLFDFQLTRSPAYEIDYWGGIYSIIIYAYLFAIWGTRVKEKRILLHALLPLSQKQNSLTRFWIASLPFYLIIIYLVVVHLIIIESWHGETGSLIGSIGITLILFAGFIRGRDDWFSHWNFGKRTRAAFVSVLIIQVLVVLIFTEKQEFNAGLVGLYGVEAFYFANLIFFLLGFTILITTIFSFMKRRSYLS